jgi:hypothetical protein
MIGKKDTYNIFNQYRSVLLEQAEDNSMSSLMNRIKTSQLDGQTKSEILNLLEDKTVQDIYRMLKLRKDSGFVDQDTANKPDPNFADEMRKARDEQRKENPEQKPMSVTI